LPSSNLGTVKKYYEEIIADNNTIDRIHIDKSRKITSQNRALIEWGMGF
jgi:hypothetical protein